MWRKKINRPKDKYYFFEIKYSKTSLTTTLIWRPLYKLTLNFYSLLLSQLPFSFSLFHQINIRDSAVIQAQAFSVAQNAQKWQQSINKCLFSHGTVCTNKSKYPLSWTPFLEKGPLTNHRTGPIWPSLANFWNKTLNIYPSVALTFHSIWFKHTANTLGHSTSPWGNPLLNTIG